MPRTKREDVFPNYIRVKDTDKEALAELVIKAKGNRSLSEFARACGVNPSTLSRLVNQKNLGPCADTLIKSIADNADSDSGVTLGMLLEAHGLAEVVVGESQRFAGLETIMKQFVSMLQDNSKAVGTMSTEALKQLQIKYNEEFGKAQATALTELIAYLKKINSNQMETLSPSEVLIQLDSLQEDGMEIEGSAKMLRQAALSLKEDDFEREAGDIILNALIRKGYFVKMQRNAGRQRFGFCIETDALRDYGIDKWNFEVKKGIYSEGIRSIDAIFRDLYLHSTYDDGIAVSLVLSDKQAFETIRQKYCGAEIYDYVSMILVDRMKRCVLDEFIFLRKGKEQCESVLVEREL